MSSFVRNLEGRICCPFTAMLNKFRCTWIVLIESAWRVMWMTKTSCLFIAKARCFLTFHVTWPLVPSLFCVVVSRGKCIMLFITLNLLYIWRFFTTIRGYAKRSILFNIFWLSFFWLFFILQFFSGENCTRVRRNSFWLTKRYDFFRYLFWWLD